MRKLATIMLSLMLITGLSACGTDDGNTPEPPPQPEENGNGNEDDNPEKNMKLKITIGSAVFTATLESNAAAYSYTRLGKVDDTTGLAVAFGTGNVNVVFESE